MRKKYKRNSHEWKKRLKVLEWLEKVNQWQVRCTNHDQVYFSSFVFV